VPFIDYEKQSLRVAGETREARKRLRSGRTSVRDSCPACDSSMFGGEYGVSAQHTIYEGTLDDPSAFHPTRAVMLADRPDWPRCSTGLNCTRACRIDAFG
jgi:hypothetical protein